MTKFRKKIFKIVAQIPKGRISTYQEVAKTLGSPRACRGVGSALNKNTDYRIPCHRVIKADGHVGGFRLGSKKKIWLLKNEGIEIKKDRVINFKKYFWSLK